MNNFISAFALCMLQVTLFTLAAALVCVAAQRRGRGQNAPLLTASLAIVGILSLVCISPWPRWGTVAPLAESAALPPQKSFAAAPALPHDLLLEAPPATIPPIADALPAEVLAAALPADAGTEDRVAQPAWHYLVYAAWVAAAIGLARAAAALHHLHRYCCQATPITDRGLHQECDSLCSELGLARPVALLESANVGVPATAGWRRPMVLLPTGWREWSSDERRAVLAHELAHVRERHFAGWLIGQVAVVAHFYHPCVHWLARRLRLEQEVSADEIAAGIFADRRQYAAILARLALNSPPSDAAVAGIGLFMSRPLLMRRIAMLRSPANSSHRAPRAARATLLALLIGVAIAVAGVRAAPQVVAQEPAAPADAAELAEAAEPADVRIPAPVIAPLRTQPSADILIPAPRVVPLQSVAPVEAVAPVPAIEPIAPVAVPAPAALPAKPPAAAQASSSPRPTSIDGEGELVNVTSLLRLSRSPAGVLGQPAPVSDQTWQINNATQLALLKSHLVLQSALRDPKIASLPIVQAQHWPLNWLHQRLHVGFYPNTEILYVTIYSAESNEEQAKQLVDAVVQAYLKEVVAASRHRQLQSRDTLARNLEKLQNEIARKLSEYYDIAKELGTVEVSGRAQLEQQIDLRRLDRVETELMRLEDEFLKAKLNGKSNYAYYEQRIAQLHDSQEKLVKRIGDRGEFSVELTQRKGELDQLQKLAAEMSLKLEVTDFNADARDQENIQVIQPATILKAPPTSGSTKSPPAPTRVPWED